MKTTQETNHAIENAKNKLAYICELVKQTNHAEDDIREQAFETINELPLSVEVRTDWHTVGQKDVTPSQYRILLTYGGPACQITGELDQHGQPSTAELEYQDWGTPWTEYPTDEKENNDLITFASNFSFRE